MPESHTLTVEQIAQMLKTRREHEQETVLILGSRVGGLFHSEQFYDILGKYSPSYYSFYQLGRAEQFTQCFDILTSRTFSEAEIYNILKQSLREVGVTYADFHIADLIQQGYFQEIISANVDNILEQALLQSDITEGPPEMREQHELEVLIPGRDLLTENHAPPYQRSSPYRITKVFGDLLSREHNITRRTGCFQANKTFFAFIQHILKGDILLVGIDPVWDEEILMAIPAGEGLVWIISDEDLEQNQYFRRILQTRPTDCLIGRNGNIKHFIAALYFSLYGGSPTFISRTSYSMEHRMKDIVNVDIEASIEPNHPKVFISYHPQDIRALDRLRTHLALYAQIAPIEIWVGAQPGDKWLDETKKAINSVKVVVLLVSADYLASRFIKENELTPILAAAEQKGTVILSVILSPCGFENTKLSQFQAFNFPSTPLTKMNKHKKEDLWERLAKHIRDLANL
jgi:hypothetical protein